MENAFVTGGSGFLGRNLIRMLRRKGYGVRALARTATAENAVRQAGAEAIPGEITDKEALRQGMEGCGLVFHAAAIVDDWGPLDDFHRVNVAGTECALRAAKESGVKRFVHVSTEAVLVGGPPTIQANESQPLPAKPLGPYPLTKGIAEKLVAAAHSDRLNTIILRPRLIWGKGDTSVLTKMSQAVKSGQWRWIEGGRYLTSTCHIDNICHALILAASKGTGGGCYFITDGEPVEFRRFVIQMLETQGIRVPDKNVSRATARRLAAFIEKIWPFVPYAKRPPVTLCGLKLIGEEVTLDDSKARRDLGYAPLVTIEQGLRDMRSVG